MTNKLTAKDLAHAICPTLPAAKTLWCGNEPTDLPRDLINGPTMLKANNASGRQALLQSADYDIENTHKAARGWLSHRHGIDMREWAYQHIDPQIFLEEFLPDDPSGVNIEYGIHCFRGVPKLFMVFERSWGSEAQKSTTLRKRLYDAQCRPHPKMDLYMAPEIDFGPQHKIEQALEYAAKLSKGIDYVRVDLMVRNEQLYFGELTLYANSGVTSLADAGLRQKLADWWDIRDTWFLTHPQSWMRNRYAAHLREQLDNGDRISG